MKKSQAALEFLMTYGWAFLIVVVIIGGFVYLGVLNPDKYVTERCITSSGFNCEEYSLVESGSNEYTITTTLKNFAGARITFTSNPVVKSDMCLGDICTISSSSDDLSGVEVAAAEELLIETVISVPNGLPRGQKILFDMEFEYMEERKDFPKEMQLELFAEIN